ncbi:hypothetical protein Vretimale_4318 [Volvox reticuliferus]|uniref:Uncharacterized protein n=2 Tax=Volvox reticuliferus TaxID=1737510 RepID=A0A8J4FHR0_9CHLO|nr:hypothetical protein Vretifemale_2893 [Volvox reticuliferus]GIL99042.1 hypothetical protein Vretimale_4318 [Volvox reticuliferus]
MWLSPMKGISAAQEISQLRSQILSLSRELEVVTQRCPSLGRLVSGTASDVDAEDLLLSDEEVQEAALRALWLGHYWGLASTLGIIPEVSTAQAERWQAVSPSVEVLHTAAADVARRLRDLTQGMTSDQASELCPNVIDYNRNYATQPIACVADIVECERAWRRVDALGVVASCRASLILAAQESESRAGFQAVETLDSFDDPTVPTSELVTLPLAAELEVRFCVSWLTYIWGRAALAGVQSQVSQEQAEQWASRLHKPATLQDFADIQQSFQELEVYGIEELLWKER